MAHVRPSSRSRRVIVLALAGLLLAGAAWAYWHRGSADEDTAYITATVERGPVTAIVTATGEVNPVTTVQVGTYVSGPIMAIDVDFNSPVQKGQRVAKIDPAPFQVKVQRAEANLATADARVAQAKADLELKTANFDRSRRLLGTNVVAQNEYDEARSAREQAVALVALAQASVRQAQAELEEARINLAYTDITSPVDGVVVSRTVDVGQTVAASFQTPTLFLIARNLTEMQVNTAVSESDIGAVHEGQPASFTVDAYPGRDFRGTIKQVRNAPTTVQNVVTYDVIVGVDNPDLALKPGMTATVRLETAHVDDALRLPLRALTFVPPGEGDHQRDGDGVWRLDAVGALAHVTVRTGVRDDAHVAITDGALKAGDVVVLALDKAVGPREGPRIPGVPRYR